MKFQDSQPLVSVVITLYNSGKYIEEALNSIINQTYKNLEIIVVNDGSTDNGPALVENKMKADARIQLFHQENSGQCAASNFGYSKTSGDFIKFFDSDDILSVNTIQQQVEVMIDKGVLDGSYIDYIRFYDDDLNTTDRYSLPELIRKDCSPIEYIKFHGTPQMFSNAIWLFHRNLFEKAGLWDERLSVNNDGEFFPRLLKHVNRLYYAPGCKLYYRTNFNSGSLSQQTSQKGVESALLAVDLMANHYRALERSETIDKIIALSYANVLELSFPKYPALTKVVESRLSEFRREYYKINTSGWYGLFTRLFGWKVARRLQIIYYNFRYN